LRSSMHMDWPNKCKGKGNVRAERRSDVEVWSVEWTGGVELSFLWS
jgi:hypothetical protein